MIPNSYQEIGRYSFKGCTSLTSIKLPSSLTEIEQQAFENCTSLTTVRMSSGPDGVTVGFQPFKGCKSLTTIEVPSATLSDWQAKLDPHKNKYTWLGY